MRNGKYCMYCGKIKDISEFQGYYASVCNKCRYTHAIKRGCEVIFLNRIYLEFKKRKIKRFCNAKELLGIDVVLASKYIQKRFKKGMNWDNHSILGWHIDHIIPCFKFDLNKLNEQKKCFNYKNLQPIWAKDHKIKSKNERK